MNSGVRTCRRIPTKLSNVTQKGRLAKKLEGERRGPQVNGETKKKEDGERKGRSSNPGLG